MRPLSIECPHKSDSTLKSIHHLFNLHLQPATKLVVSYPARLDKVIRIDQEEPKVTQDSRLVLAQLPISLEQTRLTL